MHAAVTLDDYRRKRDPDRTPEPFGGSDRAARSASSSSGTPRAAALRLAARARRRARELGGPEGRAARRPASATSRCTSRIIRSTTPTSRARSRPGSTAPARWRSGIAARTSSSRRRRTAGSPCGCTASGSTGSGRSFRPTSTAIRRNWLLLRKDGARRPARSYAPMLATSTDALPTGDDWAFEPKWDGYRALAHGSRGGEATLAQPERQRPHGALPGGRRALGLAVRSPSAVLDGEVCALDETGRSGFGLLQQGEGSLVFVAFDLLERDGEPLARRTYLERRASARGAARHRPSRACCSPRPSTTAPRSSRPPASTGSRAWWPSGRRSPTSPGRRSPDWRKLKLKQRQELVIAGFTRGKGRRSDRHRRARARRARRGRPALCRQRRARGSTDGELDRLERLLAPLRRDDVAVRRGAEAAARPARAT